MNRVTTRCERQLVRGGIRPGSAFTVAEFGTEENVERLTAWFTDQWSGRAAATFNRHLDALRSASGFWASQGWLAGDPARRPWAVPAVGSAKFIIPVDDMSMVYLWWGAWQNHR